MRKIIFLMFIAAVVNASGVKIASGAGYKKPIMEVVKLYEVSKGIKVEPIFGNMKQISSQAKSSDIALLIGDKKFLSQKSGLDFVKYNFLGKGYVVLAYAQGIKLDKVEDIAQERIKKVAMPAPKKAIYGIAGKEFLISSKLDERIKNKLYVVATVPQVANYLITKEVEAGIINLTAALSFKDKLGGYIKVDENSYSPIDIVAGELSNCDTSICKDFVEFLQSSGVKKIFQKYGM